MKLVSKLINKSWELIKIEQNTHISDNIVEFLLMISAAVASSIYDKELIRMGKNVSDLHGWLTQV